MPINTKNLDLIIQYSLLAAGDEDDYLSRQLGPIHIIKYVYLADLNYAKHNEGETYTGAEWIFYKFGPWSQDVYARIEPALLAINANKKSIPSDFEDKEDWVRWDKHDEYLFNEKQKQLPSKITVLLKQLIHKFGKDTSSLLDYVYKTIPMLHAAPKEQLNFSLVKNKMIETHTELLREPTITKKRNKEFKQGMSNIKKRLQEKKLSKTELINPISKFEYDEVYIRGMEWLESLSGEQFTSSTISAEFEDTVWKSSSRRGGDVS